MSNPEGGQKVTAAERKKLRQSLLPLIQNVPEYETDHHITSSDRHQYARELRSAGYSRKQIADAFGVKPSSVRYY